MEVWGKISYDFTQEDFSYIRKFDLIYTNLNAYIDDDIEEIASLGLPGDI